jgi:predicted patatin/cPLA2 family phospholipase
MLRICIGLLIRLFYLEHKFEKLKEGLSSMWSDYNYIRKRFEDTANEYSKLVKRFRKQIEEEGFNIE